MSSDTPTLPDRKACASCGKEFTGGETTCSDDGTTLTSIRREGLTGTVADKYEILSALGDGGWGTVYKAQHILLQRPVAIKTLHRHMVESGSALKRFKQEALAGSQLDHPHISRVLDFGITPEGVPYIVMDFLEGLSLAETLDAGGYVEPRRGANIFAQVASALAHAHRNGVVHRDLKPANIMLIEHDGMPDFVKIVDFGIAKIIRTDSDETSQLTETGQLFGSPLYMSPEQCTGRNLDGRSDIYSLGCVMYRTLTGQPPFHVRDLPDCVYKHVNETPAAFEYVCPDHPIPAELEAIVFKCLLKNPNERFQTMGDLEEALVAWMDGKPVPMESRSADGTPVPSIGETTTRLKAYRSPSSVSSQSNPVIPVPAQMEITTESSLSAQSAPPAETNANGTRPATEAETARLNLSHMVALVATSLLILLPIGYFVARKTTQVPQTTNSGPVDSNLIKTAEQRASQPDSAAQQMPNADASLKLGIQRFNDGHFDSALKIFSTVAYAKQPASQRATLWQALTLNELFRYNDAKSVLQKYMKRSNDKGIDSARALNALGFSCSNTGQLDEADGYFDRARLISEKLTGPDRVVHAQNLRGMAELALGQKKYKQAKMQLDAALAIDQQYGAPELEIANVENDLGQTYFYLKQFDKARECYDTALTMRQNKLKGNNPLIAYSLKCIASVDYQQKKVAAAESRLKQALSITKQNLLDENLTDMQKAKLNLDVADIYGSLGAISETKRQYTEAVQNFNYAAGIYASLYGESDPRVIRFRKSVLELERRLPRAR